MTAASPSATVADGFGAGVPQRDSKTIKRDGDCGLTGLRIGAVSYLNTKPLVYGLQQRAKDCEVIYDLPSRLADQLADGRLDVALVPSIEYLNIPGYKIVSDACIGCRGEVLSVRLLSRKPMSQIQSLALDEGSRTSAILARILLQERFGIEPELSLLPQGRGPEQCTADAVLLIGDRAIHLQCESYIDCWDLGRQWCEWSGLPFVFAMWVAREGVEAAGLETVLSAARDAGVAHLEEIAATEAETVGLSPQATLCYLRDNLHFYLGAEEQLGLGKFYHYATRLGVVEEATRNE